MKAGASFWIGVACVSMMLVLPARLAAQPVALTHAELHKYVATPTVTASRSGSWSDAGIWSTGAVPGERSRVAIPTGVTVTVDAEFPAAHDWIRVDG